MKTPEEIKILAKEYAEKELNRPVNIYEPLEANSAEYKSYIKGYMQCQQDNAYSGESLVGREAELLSECISINSPTERAIDKKYTEEDMINFADSILNDDTFREKPFKFKNYATKELGIYNEYLNGLRKPKRISKDLSEFFGTKIAPLLDSGSLEKALVDLYMTLNDEAHIYKNYDNCNKFLKHLSSQILITDILVHVLNALSPIKQELSNWDEFVTLCKNFFIETEGEEKAKQLLNVIM